MSNHQLNNNQTMKTINTLTNKPSLKLLTICSLLLAATAAFACEKIPTHWGGTGVFGSSQKDLKAMGDTRLFLEGLTTSMSVYEADYDGSCRTTAYGFFGTTPDGFAFRGTAVPKKDGGRQTSITTFTMQVTSITITDPATSEVLATDDGGFKIDFTSGFATPGAALEPQATEIVAADAGSLISPDWSGIFFPYYEGTLKFPREVTDACPLVQRGDEGKVVFFAFADAGNGNNKVDLGVVTFSTTTTSGVPVSGQGDLVIGSNSGTLHVTSLTIGDPAGAYCALVQLDINVGLKLNKPHGHRLVF